MTLLDRRRHQPAGQGDLEIVAAIAARGGQLDFGGDARRRASLQRRLGLVRPPGLQRHTAQGDAVASGDLKLPAGFGPESLAFGLWAITFGGNSIAASSPSLAKLGIEQPLEVIRANCNALLDGFGWRPLSTEIVLPELYARVVSEVFPAEFSQVGGGN